ncbi:predicted amidohydrolase [Longilinea arvoryzae]|uniref:Predicted amidohydrolase n=1 Tax=Longilinea arvoryzae TaxID=360412 RepID=A0A0S7B640_9CHLR|nr:nitrilase-related carbon-nitrogen hydrolase [Longilinea arvoryzae]GAP12423.1 predicted amidohydrolase [Longilinea arvoryzae]
MLKIGVAQADFKLAQREANLEILRKLLAEAGKAGVDVLVLPELANSGYNFESMAEAEALAEVVDEGPACSLLRDWSAAGRLVVSGLCERGADVLYNSAVVYADGRLEAVYHKVHLFANEGTFFQPGNEKPPVVNFHRQRLGVMICFDWFFPEMARSLALRGAQIILHPANLVLPYCQKAMLTRSLENRIFTATANRTGSERGLAFSGLSQITSPTGELLTQAGDKFTGVVWVEVDLDRADDKWVTQQNHLFNDRRPELYDDLCVPKI